MDRLIFLMLACIAAGFSLLQIDLNGPYLDTITQFTSLIGILAIIISSLFIIYKGIRELLGK